MMCTLLVVTAVNSKLCDGRSKWDRLALFNDVFKYYLQDSWDTKKSVDQLVVTEDKMTPAKSIQDRVWDIKTDTDHTPVSTMVERIMRLTRNVFLPRLRKFLDSNGHIRSDQ